MRFDYSDTPLLTLVGEAYVCLLDPMHVETEHPLDARTPYVKTLCQIGSRPTARELQTKGYKLTKAMPSIGVHIKEARGQTRTSLSIDWELDIDVHCFSAAMGRGAELRQDRQDGTRSLTQHVVEYLHMRLLPGDMDGQGIEVRSIEHIVTTETVDWWAVRTSVEVTQDIRRQRTYQADGLEIRHVGKPKGEPHHKQVLDFDTIQQQRRNP